MGANIPSPLTVRCPRCGARAGRPCKVRGGFHHARFLKVVPIPIMRDIVPMK